MMMLQRPAGAGHHAVAAGPAWLPLADGAVVALASLLALLLRGPPGAIAGDEWIGVVAYFGISGVGFIAFMWGRRQYWYLPEYFSGHDAREICESVIGAVAVACLCAFILHRLDAITRGFIVLQGGMTLAGALGLRAALKAMLTRRRGGAKWHDVTNVLVVGVGPLTAFYIDALEVVGRPYLRVAGIVAETPEIWAAKLRGHRILGTILSLGDIIRDLDAHGVVVNRICVALPQGVLTQSQFKELRRVAREFDLELEHLGEALQLPGPPGGASKDHAAAASAHWYLPVKRGIDIVGAAALLVFLAPVIVATAILVLIDVGWPVIFWQERPGRFGVPFRLRKFRTMRGPTGAGGAALTSDERTSRLGHLIRRLRFDELPQLLNVLSGEMSLIGPRPLLPLDQPADPDRRLSVRPGVSGWAQVNGGRLMSVTEKSALDVWYTDNLGPLVDLKVALLTLWTIVAGEWRNPSAVHAAMAPGPKETAAPAERLVAESAEQT